MFLVLISTVIDFIGGLGVAGVRLARAPLLRLGALLVGSSLVLCADGDAPRERDDRDDATARPHAVHRGLRVSTCSTVAFAGRGLLTSAE